MDHEGSSFLTGCAGNPKLFFFAKEDDAKTAAGYQNSTFFGFFDEDWNQYTPSVPWAAIAMATHKLGDGPRTVVALGVHGEFWELRPASVATTTGTMKGVRFHVRSLSVVGEHFYAAGMDRTVFQRTGVGTWVPVGPGARPSKRNTVTGFEDLAGFSEEEIYAAGWQGEIWLRHQGAWRQIDSPVSANLNAVCCAEDGLVYVVGDGGAMARGRGDEWEVIATSRSENLMDVCDLAGTVYVVTDFRILKLVDDALVPEDEFADPDDRPSSCLFLQKAPGVLLSIGPHDVMKRADGAWERLA